MLAGVLLVGYVVAVYTMKPSPQSVAIKAAQASIEKALLSPTSATWQDITCVEGFDGEFVVAGLVVAQNAFGVSIPTRFSVDVQVTDDTVTVIRRSIER